MENLLQDIRYGFRILLKSRAFLAVALITLTLGIGANTAIYSVVQAVLLKSLPYPNPDRLMVIDENQVTTGQTSVAWLNFLDWQSQTRSFESLAGFRGDSGSLTGVGEPLQVRIGETSASFFPILDVQPLLGRAFTAAEDQPSAPRTAVLSYEFWRTHLGGDPAVIGKDLTLDGAPYHVVGVMPAGFKFFLRKVDIYRPIGMHANDHIWLNRGNHSSIYVLGRLKDGVTQGAAQSDLDTVMGRLERQYPDSNSGEHARVQSLYHYRFADLQPVLYALMGSVLCVLLIGCANVANLLQARSIGRQKEFAIRTAVGAPRFRLVRQMLTESVLLAMIGGTLGLLLAPSAVAALIRLAPQDIPRLSETRIDGGVLLFTFCVALLSGIVFGLVPALQSSRLGISGVLKETSQSTTDGRSTRWLRSGLFVFEVALALLLIIPCGLMLRSLRKAQSVTPGFNPNHVLALDVTLPEKQYPEGQPRLTFYTQTLNGVRSLPGVVSASAVMCPPAVGECWGSVYQVSDRPTPKQSDLPHSVFNVADTDYFRTMEIGLREGRYFNDGDRSDSPPVVIVNRTFARTWWPNESAIGKRVKQGFPQDRSPFREIVGVVDDVKQDGLDTEQKPEVFLPLAQDLDSAVTMMVRTEGNPMDFAKATVHRIHQVDDKLPLSAIQPASQYLDDSLASRRFSTLLLNLFGGLAVLLAAVGIYGVVAYSVAQRTREIGIRIALGARPADVLGMILSGGTRLMAIGMALGLLGALAVSRLLSGMLFDLAPTDPVTFFSVVSVLSAVVLMACLIPARRASKVDPMIALRYE